VPAVALAKAGLLTFLRLKKVRALRLKKQNIQQVSILQRFVNLFEKFISYLTKRKTMEEQTFNFIVWAWILLALIMVAPQLKITAPYGRHTSKKWGSLMDNRIGWTIMEGISPIAFGFFFLSGPVEKSSPMWCFFFLWTLHYLNRGFVFPWRTRTSGKKMPIAIVASAVLFNVINGSVNGYYLGYLSETYPESWWSDPRMMLGLGLFLAGAFINLQSDNRLLNLREPGETGYKIPRGGLFSYISCPNHFGEIIEWIGFAIMAWNLPAFSFAIWTAANLIPRAISHHQWYKKQFEDYPERRYAVIPGLV